MFRIRNENVKFDRYGLYSDHNQLGNKSKEFKVMVMVDIFWYLMLVVGSELPLLVKQSVHNCTWIKHGSGRSWDSLLSF
jgi:hypothetical protein